MAAPIWNEFMKRAYQAKSLEESPFRKTVLSHNEFTLPKEIENFTLPEPTPTATKPMLNGELAFRNKVKIDKISGKLATRLTPPDLINEKIYQEVHSILYYVDKDNPLEDYPAEPTQDPQFSNWEKSVLGWASGQPCSAGVCYNQNPPSEYDDVHIPENQPEIKITRPEEGDLIKQNILTIEAQAEAPLGIKQLDFFFNEQLVGTDMTKPYSITFNLFPYLVSSTPQTIKVRAYDQVLNRQEDETFIMME